MAAAPGRTLTLWRLTDGKPGHEKQALGLAQALERLAPARRHDIPASSLRHPLRAWLTRRFPPGRCLPDPDLILAAGHATHLAALAARRARGGRVVVLMRPSLPTAWFDLCVIPEHDRPPESSRVFTTRGAINTAYAAPDKVEDQGLLLIGGVSEHYRWDSAVVAHQVREIVRADDHIHWTLTTSRRTPADFLPMLHARDTARLDIVPYTEAPPGWLEQSLARAARAWITPDSVSMVYEALTAGARVGLLELVPTAPETRVARGIRTLRDHGWVASFSDWRASGALPPAQPLDEATRCARHLIDRWFAPHHAH